MTLPPDEVEVTPQDAMAAMPDRDSSELLGAILTANARSLAATNGRLRDIQEERLRDMARAYVDLMEDLFSIEEAVDSMRLSRVIGRGMQNFKIAQQELDKEDY